MVNRWAAVEVIWAEEGVVEQEDLGEEEVEVMGADIEAEEVEVMGEDLEVVGVEVMGVDSEAEEEVERAVEVTSAVAVVGEADLGAEIILEDIRDMVIVLRWPNMLMKTNV